MAGYLGKIGEYDSATEEWPSYQEREARALFQSQ